MGKVQAAVHLVGLQVAFMQFRRRSASCDLIFFRGRRPTVLIASLQHAPWEYHASQFPLLPRYYRRYSPHDIDRYEIEAEIYQHR